MKRLALSLIFTFVIMSAIHNANAQIFRRAGHAISTTSRLKFRFWKIKEGGAETKISQWALPVYVYYPVSNQFTLRVTESVSFSSLGDNRSLNGLSDVKVKASYRLMDDSVLLAAGLGLPIGKNSLDDEQAEVAYKLYTDTLDFGVTRLGEGINLNNDAGIFTSGAGMRYALDNLILNTGLNFSTGSRNDGDISGFGFDLGLNYRF